MQVKPHTAVFCDLICYPFMLTYSTSVELLAYIFAAVVHSSATSQGAASVSASLIVNTQRNSAQGEAGSCLARLCFYALLRRCPTFKCNCGQQAGVSSFACKLESVLLCKLTCSPHPQPGLSPEPRAKSVSPSGVDSERGAADWGAVQENSRSIWGLPHPCHHDGTWA